MEVSAEKLKKMVDYIEQSQPVLEKAAESDKQVKDLAPSVVDELIEKGALDASQRDRAILSIQDPVKALESLRKLAGAMGEKKPEPAPSMGVPAGSEKAAGEESEPRSKMRKSDQIFLERFGFGG